MRYFTADPHLLHEKVAAIRFPNSENPVRDMMTVFLRNIRGLSRGDQLWILGDLTVGYSHHETLALNAIKSVLDEMGPMAPQIHFIAGNHDTVSSVHRDAWKSQRKFLDVFTSVQQYAKIRIAGKDVLLSHFPYASLGDGPNREGARYPLFRIPELEDGAAPLIHGHTHQTNPHAPRRLHIRDEFVDGPIDYNQYCVSWDVARKFVKEDELIEWLTDPEENEDV